MPETLEKSRLILFKIVHDRFDSIRIRFFFASVDDKYDVRSNVIRRRIVKKKNWFTTHFLNARSSRSDTRRVVLGNKTRFETESSAERRLRCAR